MPNLGRPACLLPTCDVRGGQLRPALIMWHVIGVSMSCAFLSLNLTSYSLFSLFNMTRLVAQEHAILFKCCILNYMILWPRMSYYRGVSKKWPIPI